MTRSTLRATETYQITFDFRDQYLYALIEGETRNYPIMKQYWQDIAHKSAEGNCKRILLENDIAENVSVMDMYTIMRSLSGMGFSQSRLALVDRHPEHREINEFGATVASNRGIKARVFDSVGDAAIWLMTG